MFKNYKNKIFAKILNMKEMILHYQKKKEFKYLANAKSLIIKNNK